MTCPRPHTRRVLPLAAVAALVLGLLTAATAHAATFQYWGYYQLTNGAWVFAHSLASLDRVTTRLTRGRTSLPRLLAGLEVFVLTTTGRRSGTGWK